MWKSWSLLFWHFFLATISQPLAAPIRVHCQRAENTSMRSTAHIEIRTCIHKPRRRYCTWDGQNNNIFFLYAIHILYIYIFEISRVKTHCSSSYFIFISVTTSRQRSLIATLLKFLSTWRSWSGSAKDLHLFFRCLKRSGTKPVHSSECAFERLRTCAKRVICEWFVAQKWCQETFWILIPLTSLD